MCGTQTLKVSPDAHVYALKQASRSCMPRAPHHTVSRCSLLSLTTISCAIVLAHAALPVAFTVGVKVACAPRRCGLEEG